eukprot:TRINITY_DN5003_c0_g1_i2.p1 TRINITY_DN5003_c0_g1~~TRINITY_DN5003_c0_g1_i2.p1  ORF type:complete len:194 (-),score=26.33 TRINITY_DN5003_c0_g1_i2:55-597(-)
MAHHGGSNRSKYVTTCQYRPDDNEFDCWCCVNRATMVKTATLHGEDAAVANKLQTCGCVLALCTAGLSFIPLAAYVYQKWKAARESMNSGTPAPPTPIQPPPPTGFEEPSGAFGQDGPGLIVLPVERELAVRNAVVQPSQQFDPITAGMPMPQSQQQPVYVYAQQPVYPLYPPQGSGQSV